MYHGQQIDVVTGNTSHSLAALLCLYCLARVHESYAYSYKTSEVRLYPVLKDCMYNIKTLQDIVLIEPLIPLD